MSGGPGVPPEESLRPRAVGERWMLLLPAGWATLPTERGPAERAIRRTADRAMRGKPRDELVRVRIEMERGLAELVAQARDQGSSVVHLLVEPVGGVPVSASLVVTELTHVDGAALDAAVEQVLGGGEGVLETGAVEVGSRPALRRLRRRQVALDEVTSQEPGWQLNVDYAVDTGPMDLLLLVFATSDDTLAEPLVAMFDAIAATLHRRVASPAAPD